MKMLRWFGFFWLVSLASVPAQIMVDLQPEQDQFLPGEKINVAVRVGNVSGQTLKLGADQDWLSFAVETADGTVMPELEKLPVAGEFELESSKTAVKRLDLRTGFDFSKPGRYRVTPTVRIKEWDKEFAGKARSLDIIQGTKMWEQDFGVPAATAGGAPEVRKYVLQQANYLKHLKLYLRVAYAADNRVIKVFPLGNILSFSRPEPQLDQASNLHLLWQTGAQSFAYRVVNPDGELILRQTYDYTGTRPRLVADDQGKVSVQGGVRRENRDDLPAKMPTDAVTNQPAASEPPITQ